MANGSVKGALKALKRDLAHAESEVVRLKQAVRALTALENPRSAGVRLPNRGKDRVCGTLGCGTHFNALRKDARFCSACKIIRRDCQPRTEEARTKACIKAARDRKKGVTLVAGAKK